MRKTLRLLVFTETYPPQVTGSAVKLGHLLAGTVPAAAYLVATASPGAASLPGREVVSYDLPPLFYRRDLRFGLSEFVRIASRPLLFRKFLAAARAFRPDAVVALFPSDRFLILGDRVARALGAPLVVDVHNLWEEALRYTAAHGGAASDRARLRIAEREERAIFGRAALRFALTGSMARFLEGKHGVPFSCLPHAFPPPPPLPAAAPGDGAPCLDLIAPGAVYGMQAGSLAAVISAVAARDDVRLTLTAAHRIERLDPALLRASGRVAVSHFPAEGDFYSRLARADAAVVCLARDGHSPEDVATALPTRVVESIRFGRPILAAAPPGSHLFGFVSENRIGIAVDPDRPGGIAAALDALRDAGLRRQFSQNASRLFEERFSVGRVGPAWLAEIGARL